MKRFLPLLLILINPLFCMGDIDFNARCKQAYKLIYSLRFQEARKLISDEQRQNPENVIPVYLENSMDFLQVTISEDRESFSKFKEKKALCLKRFEKENTNSPYYRYCLADMYLHWALAKAKFSEFFIAAFEINKAIKLLEKNRLKHPDFIPNLKGLGIAHALIGTIPDEYSWVLSMISLEGNVAQGTDELDTLISVAVNNKNYDFLKTEGLILLNFTVLNLNKAPYWINRMQYWFSHPDITNVVSGSPLLCYSHAIYSIQTGNNDRAIAILESQPTGRQYFRFYFLDYMMGEAKLNRLDKDAYCYFFDFVLNFKGLHYVKTAYQKIAWYYAINNNPDKYREYMQKAKKYGASLFDSDKQAYYESKSLSAPNPLLLKARLLFDGGYYPEAFNLLHEKTPVDFTTPRDKSEYTYRMARILHEWGEPEQAIKNYEVTITNGQQYDFYFAANACLQLGIIYESGNDYPKARFYYNKCLSLKNKEYRNSISQKAKAGLCRINGK